VTVSEAAQQLKAGRRTNHPELFLFSSWGEVQEYAEHDAAGRDLRAIVQLVDTHGPETIIRAVGRLSAEDEAQVTVSTAHKAKGREWPSVRIGPGFEPPPIDDDGRQRPLSLAEARLIYVAVTRARELLDPAGIAWADEYEEALSKPAALIDLSLTSQLKFENSPVSLEEPRLGVALQLAPAAGAIVGNDLFEHGGEGGGVDGFALADGHGAGGLVAVARSDDPVGIRDDGAVVEEHVDVILCCQQRADVALQDEIRLAGALDGFGYLRVGGVN
jgi:hypothetical protein